MLRGHEPGKSQEVRSVAKATEVANLGCDVAADRVSTPREQRRCSTGSAPGATIPVSRLGDADATTSELLPVTQRLPPEA